MVVVTLMNDGLSYMDRDRHVSILRQINMIILTMYDIGNKGEGVRQWSWRGQWLRRARQGPCRHGRHDRRASRTPRSASTRPLK